MLAIVTRERVERIVQHVGGRVGDAAHHLVMVDDAVAALVQILRHAGDFGRLVAYALEVGDHLDGGHDGAQVVGGRLAAHDQMAARIVQRHFELVDDIVFAHHAVGALGIADAEARHRIEELGFNDAAHQGHFRADRFEFVVVLLG
ncbi:hypothetical protein D9M69_579240 [compost metagenome]